MTIHAPASLRTFELNSTHLVDGIRSKEKALLLKQMLKQQSLCKAYILTILMNHFRQLGKQQVYRQIASRRGRQHDFNLLLIIARTVENRLLSRGYLA